MSFLRTLKKILGKKIVNFDIIYKSILGKKIFEADLKNCQTERVKKYPQKD